MLVHRIDNEKSASMHVSNAHRVSPRNELEMLKLFRKSKWRANSSMFSKLFVLRVDGGQSDLLKNEVYEFNSSVKRVTLPVSYKEWHLGNPFLCCVVDKNWSGKGVLILRGEKGTISDFMILCKAKSFSKYPLVFDEKSLIATGEVKSLYFCRLFGEKFENAISMSHFNIKEVDVFSNGDLDGLAKLQGIVGSNGKYPCLYCEETEEGKFPAFFLLYVDVRAHYTCMYRALDPRPKGFNANWSKDGRAKQSLLRCNKWGDRA